MVVVPQDGKVAQAEVAGERGSLSCNALLQASVTTERVNAVGEGLHVRFIEAGGEMGACHCHTDSVRNTCEDELDTARLSEAERTLPKWPCCNFNTRNKVFFGVSRKTGVEMSWCKNNNNNNRK